MAAEPTPVNSILDMKTWKYTSSADVTTALRRYRYGNSKEGYYTRWDVVRGGAVRTIYPKWTLAIGGAVTAWWYIFVHIDSQFSEAMRLESRDHQLMCKGRSQAFERLGFDEATVTRYADFIRLSEIKRLQSNRDAEERRLRERVERDLKWALDK